MTNVLLIDDDEHQRSLFRAELEDVGLQVDVAASADEGVAKLSHNRPDVVVLDITMPGKDGIACMGNILERDNTLPVILHSAYAQYRENFMTWCAAAYVLKSSHCEELIQEINRVAATPECTEHI
jgi:two-component system response regulator (stage 0 sporulation protein F)